MMDELIREFERLAALALRGGEPKEASAFNYAAEVTRIAKRRMAEREPAWDLVD